MVKKILSEYNRTPHSTLNFKTPNQVHNGLLNNSNDTMLPEDIQKYVQEEAAVGHEKYLKCLEKRSEELYNKVKLVNIGDEVMVLEPKCANNRKLVLKNYLGAAKVEKKASVQEHMFYVRWLHNGSKRSVKAGQVSSKPFPNQYVYFFFSFSFINCFLVV